MADQNASLTERVAAFEGGEAVHAVAFLGGVPAIARDDGEVVFGPPAQARRLRPHPEGAILCAVATASALFTGGDDGLIVASDAAGTSQVMHDAKGKWIDAVAARSDGALAWAVGKAVFARDGKGKIRTTAVATTARGLAFAAKGYRLAIAHYNGASLWFPNADAPPDPYEWKGSHVAVDWSPDGRFLVTAMQEPALHGWRLVDRAHMRMSGYPSRVRSMSWSADGEWLATSGAESCVVWPFRDKDGPMKKPPLECAARPAKVSRVAFHPKSLLLAVGYEDGWVLLCRPADNGEILVRRGDTDDSSAITALAWNADGDKLLMGTAGGYAGLLSLPAR